MELKPHEFTLTDADGESHAYAVTEMFPEDGLDMSLKFTGLAMGPLGKAIGSLIAQADVLVEAGGLVDALGDKGADESVMDNPEALKGLMKVLKGVDFGAIAEDVQKALMRSDAKATVKKLAATAIRDGQPLRLEAAFSTAYSRNWFELYKLCGEVIRYNRFFPGLGISSTGLLEMAKDALKTRAPVEPGEMPAAKG